VAEQHGGSHADLGALSHALEGGDASLGEFLGRVKEGGTAARLGAGRMARLRRLAWLRAGLEELAVDLEQSGGGLGRARVGLVLERSVADQLGVRFPYNPFQAPAVVADGEGLASLSEGLLEGQIRQAAAGIALVRAARLELDDPAQGARSGPPSPPTWSELTAEERAICPPLLLVIRDGSPDLGSLESLVQTGLPLKALVLAEPGGVGEPELAALVLGVAGARVTQGSIGRGDALTASWVQAWDHAGPSLHRVHAPSPASLGLDTDQAIAHARQALDDGTWTRFRFDPGATGVFGTRVTLEADSSEASPALTLLQELSGAQTPFTAGVKDQVRSELEAVHAAEVAELQRRHTAELEAQRQELEAGIAGRIERRLLALAGYQVPDGTAQG